MSWPDSSSGCHSALQVSMVAALFVAALMVLWTTGASVVARERRRSQAKDLLERAGNELAARGREIIARAGDFPDFPEEPSRAELDRKLSAKATVALANYRWHRGGLPRPQVQELPRHRRAQEASPPRWRRQPQARSGATCARTRRVRSAAARGRPDRHPGRRRDSQDAGAFFRRGAGTANGRSPWPSAPRPSRSTGESSARAG